MKRFEEEKNKVILYFTKLGNEQVCPSFIMKESNKIEGHSNSTIKIYDYYKPEFEASKVNWEQLFKFHVQYLLIGL